jgi:hypothetical protein
MFEGTRNVPQFDIPVMMAGGENNAFTNNDLTNYYITIPANNIETAFWLESDRMRGPRPCGGEAEQPEECCNGGVQTAIPEPALRRHNVASQAPGIQYPSLQVAGHWNGYKPYRKG